MLQQTSLLGNNPFAVLTAVVAPAILTNASSVLALGISNHLARVVDRTRVVYAQRYGFNGIQRVDGTTGGPALTRNNVAARAAPVLRRAGRALVRDSKLGCSDGRRG